jgi:hypothetical protein
MAVKASKKSQAGAVSAGKTTSDESNPNPAVAPEVKSHSFDPPAEAEWHRMISQAAYYIAQNRGSAEGNTLEDWLAAEAQVRASMQSD